MTTVVAYLALAELATARIFVRAPRRALAAPVPEPTSALTVEPPASVRADPAEEAFKLDFTIIDGMNDRNATDVVTMPNGVAVSLVHT